MSRRASTFRAALIAALVAVAAAGCGDDGEPSEASTSDEFDAERAFADLRAQVEIGPRPSGSPGARRTVALIRKRLAQAGVEDVRVQRPWANVVAALPGSEPGTVVVGAHYETKDSIPGFVGANDGASGVAVLLELARTLPRPLPGPSLQLVFFDGEEARGNRSFATDGTRGSDQYVRLARAGGGQGAAPLADIRAMVLFDMVGDCELRVPLEANSDPALYAAFSDAAEQRTGAAEPFAGAAPPVDDDHVPFAEAGVPALDLIDFRYGPGGPPGRWWHTPDDTLDKVCAESLDAIGEAALVALPQIGRA